MTPPPRRLSHWLAGAPCAVAAWPVLHMAANNPGEFSPGDVVAAVLGAAALGAMCLGIAGWLTRRVSGAVVGGLVLAAGIYAPALLALLRRPTWLGLAAHGPLVPLLMACTVALVLLRLRRGRELPADVVRAIALASYTLATLAGAGAVRAIARAGDPPLGTSPGRPAASATLPDIYVVVLDEYGSRSVLRRHYAYDLRPFEDSLQALGFRLPVTWSNYAYTAASVASMLDMRHVTDLAREVAPDEPSMLPLHARIATAAGLRLAREHGYRIVLVPSSDFEGTRSHPLADRVVVADGLRERVALHATSPFALAAVRHTLAGPLLTALGIRLGSPARAMAVFSGLRAAIGEPGPKVVVAHVMTTHLPFYFTATCAWAPLGRQSYRDGYRDQVACTNRRLLEVVTAIVQGPRPAMILLQGDHGPGMLGALHAARPEQATPAQLAERLGAFAAYRLPDGGELADTVTPVNVLRLVFNRLLGTALPRVADDAYHSVEGRRYDFVRVDPRVLLGDTAGPAPATGR